MDYEFPLNERVRTLLRMEGLFTKMKVFAFFQILANAMAFFKYLAAEKVSAMVTNT